MNVLKGWRGERRSGLFEEGVFVPQKVVVVVVVVVPTRRINCCLADYLTCAGASRLCGPKKGEPAAVARERSDVGTQLGATLEARE